MKKEQNLKLHQRLLRAAIAVSLALGGTSFASGSFAGTATSSMSVGASVAANCTISAGALAFGAYDPVSANASSALNGSATVNVTCTSGSAGKITLGQGSNADAGSTDAAPLRRMKEGTANYLSYSLFQDSTRATVWGNDATTGVAHTGTGASIALTVYGSVGSGQNVPAGTYADTVVATVTF